MAKIWVWVDGEWRELSPDSIKDINIEFPTAPDINIKDTSWGSFSVTLLTEEFYAYEELVRIIRKDERRKMVHGMVQHRLVPAN